ncbi:MAG: polysaccharide biosynthesis/export family protein [Acidobacteria bacterium]|nr:polysaccharide biosynthesis/export family protein [Acidobacteriota bacterium]
MKSSLLVKARRCGLAAALSVAGAVSVAAQEQRVASNAASTSAAGVASDGQRAAAGDQYRIGPRDVLTIRVTAPDIVPQFSAEAMEVNECGMIPLLSVQNEEQNEIKAAGMTTNELQEQLRKFYTKYKRNPQVVVKVREYNSQPVAINGAVARPGQFQLRRPVRLLELLQFYSGGATEKSGGRIQIARMPALGMCETKPANGATPIDEATAPSFLSFKLEDTLKGDERANPFLQPGDVITLPEAKEAYVVGNVLRPGPVLLRDEHLTVTRAIAMVGGRMPDTRKEKVRIIRPNPNGGESQEIPVDIAAIENHKAEDIVVQANDIIEVPVAGGKRLLRNLMNTVVPAAGNLPVQVIR